MKIVIGSRGSKLALRQSEEVKEALEKLDSTLEIEIKVIHTKGDRILDKPLNQIGDKGLFIHEIEEQLLAGDIDLAVHSMKDMPSVLPKGLIFAGTLPSADPRDCLVFNGDYHSLEDLPPFSVVATGSPRRKYQLLKYRPDLKVVGIRGNVETRLRKMKEEKIDALVLASAGLKRLGLENLIGQYLEDDIMVPACSQGILALEVKENSKLLPFLKQIEDYQSTKRMQLERLYLETIGGSCHLPIGVHVTFVEQGIQCSFIYGDEEGKNLCIHHELIEKDFELRIQSIALQMKEQVENHG